MSKQDEDARRVVLWFGRGLVWFGTAIVMLATISIAGWWGACLLLGIGLVSFGRYVVKDVQ